MSEELGGYRAKVTYENMGDWDKSKKRKLKILENFITNTYNDITMYSRHFLEIILRYFALSVRKTDSLGIIGYSRILIKYNIM